jgi:hypothetical protein
MTAMSERMEKKRKEEERLDRKRKAKKRNQFDDVKDLRNKFGNKKVHRFMQFNKDQCGKYLQYKRRGRKMARCLMDMLHSLAGSPSPTPSFDDGDTPDSDVDADVDNNDDADQGKVDADVDAGELFGVKDERILLWQRCRQDCFSLLIL